MKFIDYFGLTKKTFKIAPQISSALKDLSVIFDKYISSISPKLADIEYASTLDSYYGTQNEQKNI